MSERQAKRIRRPLRPSERQRVRELWPQLNHRERGEFMCGLLAAHHLAAFRRGMTLRVQHAETA